MPTRRLNWSSLIVRAFCVMAIAITAIFSGPAGFIPWFERGISKAQAGSAVVGGRRMSCNAAKVEKSNKSPVLAYAQAGKIVLNPRKMRRYPSVTQRIIFLHECAHQYVGLDETQADCWAVRAGKRRGWLSLKGINTVCRSFYNDPGSSAHLPGPARCDAMKLCYNNTKSPKRRSKKKRRKKK